MSDIREQARGRWPELLPALGVPSQYLRNKGGPCPICKAGKDRFRFDDKEGSGSWYCNQCGAGNGFDLAMKTNGWDFREVTREVKQVLGTVDDQPKVTGKPERSDADKRLAMKRAWEAARPITPESAAGLYLNRRVGLTEFPTCLRATGRLYYNHGSDQQAVHFPAMLARISDADGKPVNIHRTYLDYDGGKAPVDDPKRVMPGPLPEGCAIRLGRPTDTLGIAEGIETALSATKLFGTPCWAVVSAGLMGQVAPAGWGDLRRRLRRQ